MNRQESRLWRVLRRVLGPLLPRDWADDIFAELAEADRRRRTTGGRSGRMRGWAADLWLTGQAVAFALGFGWERVRESVRAFAVIGMESAVRDAGHAARGLMRAPAFFLIVVVTLGLGIGANAAMFSVMRAVLLAPMPYPDPDRLVTVTPYPWTHLGVLVELGDAAPIEEKGAYYPGHFALTAEGRPEHVEGVRVTPGLLSSLGAQVVLGRLFTEGDARVDALPTVVLAHRYWTRVLGGSPDVVGRTIRVDGLPHEIIGVTGPAFRMMGPRLEDPELWLPMEMAAVGAEGAALWGIPMIRLTADADAAGAQSVLDRAVARYQAGPSELGELPRGAPRWVSLRSTLTAEVRRPLLVLQLAAVAVLLLAGLNVANLLSVRFRSRKDELAVRRALGASRVRLVRQLLTETLLLSVSSALAVLVFIRVVLDAVVRLAPAGVPRIGDAGLDASVVGFTLIVTVLAGTVLGLLASWSLAGGKTPSAPGHGGRATARTHRFAHAVVVTQVALTLVLLAAGGLLVRTFVSLTEREPGFRTEDVLAVGLEVPETRFDRPADLEAFYEAVVERLERVPGIETVAVSNNLPIARGNSTRAYVVEGETEPRFAEYGVVAGGYFAVLDLPVRAGRVFDDTDVPDGPRVAVIDEAMASEAWSGADPLGGRFRFVDDETWITVVGIVGGVRGGGLISEPATGFYVPNGQRPRNATELAVGRQAVVLVRSAREAADLTAEIRAAVWEVDPDQPLEPAVPLGELVADGVAPQRFRAVLLAGLAGLALLLAGVGVYGVVGQVVEERTRELGLRRAVGATAADVLREVMGGGLRLTGLGVVLGLTGVTILAPSLRSLLFGVGPTDPATLAGAALLVVVVALLGCAVPAWRASRVDPTEAMRRG